MTEFIVMIAIFLYGILVGVVAESDTTFKKCVKANPTVPNGQIKEFCNERLYRK